MFQRPAKYRLVDFLHQDDDHDHDHGDVSAEPSLLDKPVATLTEFAEYLVDGFWDAQSFDVQAGDVLTVRLNGLTAEGQQLARWALDSWAEVTGLVFEEIEIGFPDILFDDNDPSGAYSTQSTDGDGNITFARVNIPVNWLNSYGTTIDSYSMQTYVHEIGHAIGLGHAGPYNGSAFYWTDALFANDSWQLSIMSYFSQTDNPTVDASYALVVTPMIVDILATDMIYGGTASTNLGDTVYGADATIDGYVGDLMGILYDGDAFSADFYAGDDVSFTIKDDGGVDTFDFSMDDSDQLVDLNSGGFSNTLGLIGNLIIAADTVIENATTGAGNDELIGNEFANELRAGAGNDTVRGGGGGDLIEGEEGTDRLYGGTDADTFLFDGATGFDIIFDFENDVDQLEYVGVSSIDDLSIRDLRAGALVSDGDGFALLLGAESSDLDNSDFGLLTA